MSKRTLPLHAHELSGKSIGFLKLLKWTFIQLLLFTQDWMDGDQALADSCAYRIVIWVGLDRPDRSSICTLWEFSETEILAQLEVTGLSACSLQGERENCAVEAFASEFCQHGQFPLLYYRSRVPVHNSWTRSPKESKHSESLKRFRPHLTINQLHIIGRRSAQLDWLRFKRLMLASCLKVMAASEQDFRATK